MKASSKFIRLSLVVWLVVMAIVSLPNKVLAAGTCYSQSDGNWDTISWWCSDISGVRSLQTNDDVVIQHSVTLNKNAEAKGITIDSGKTFNNGPYTLTANGSYLTNNGTYNRNTGTYSFTANGGVYGTSTTTFNNVSISGGVDFYTKDGSNNTHRARIEGTLTINPNGYVSVGDESDGRPIYGTSSTLIFNTGNLESAPYNSNEEWDAQGGSTVGTSPGVPQNVELASNTWLSLNTNPWTRPMGGNLTIGSGSGLILQSDSNSALTVAGSVTNNGKLKQTWNVPASGAVTFINISTSKYYGVEITANGTALGNTTVTVSGNQICSQANGTPVKRCFDVAPTSQQSANIKFYYQQTEMQGQTYDALNVWNYHSSTWNAVTRGGDKGSCGSGAIDCYVQGNAITNYSPFALKVYTPLAVDLAAFTTAATPAGVALAWETASETDNAGFNVYRAGSEAGPWTRLNAALIPAATPGSSSGHAYTWTDATAAANTAYVYRLEAVALDGTAEILEALGVTYRPARRTWLPLAR